MPVTPCSLEHLVAHGLVPFLPHLRRGLEKESLRVTADGRLSTLPHPRALGSALTHPRITTDFSEALLEFITAPHESVAAMLRELDDIHRFACANIGDEILWNSSMPCLLGADDAIPIAQYGSSNLGRMKTLYRVGLSHRYGRRMQAIAGIHYNFSMPESFWAWYQRQCSHPGGWQALRDERYFALIRNFRRQTWLLLYLFGASPALCRSFLGGRTHTLETLRDNTLYAHYGTSLRMGDLGYQSNAQENLYVCYNNLRGYVGTLQHALAAHHPDYMRIGVKVDGEYRQLRDTLLQIENELYSTIRPKRITRPDETPSHALRERGVEYVEIRCLDINPFLPLGIDATTARFLDTFLLGCLLQPSPLTDEHEYRQIRENTRRTVYEGRRPNLLLQTREGEKPLQQWGRELLAGLLPIATLLDEAHGGRAYRDALQAQQHKIECPQDTPSARVLAQLRTTGCAYFDFALQQSLQQARAFRDHPLPENTARRFEQMARESLEQQRQLELADREDFDTFLHHYFSA